LLSRWFEKKPDSPAPGSDPGDLRPQISASFWRVGVVAQASGERAGAVHCRRRIYLANKHQLPDQAWDTASFLSDLVYDACTGDWKKGEDEDGNPVWDVEGLLDQSLNFSGRMFDVVLLWTALDYLPEPLCAAGGEPLPLGNESGRTSAGAVPHPHTG
jgi:hypothetical protein